MIAGASYRVNHDAARAHTRRVRGQERLTVTA